MSTQREHSADTRADQVLRPPDRVLMLCDDVLDQPLLGDVPDGPLLDHELAAGPSPTIPPAVSPHEQPPGRQTFFQR